MKLGNRGLNLNKENLKGILFVILLDANLITNRTIILNTQLK